MTDTPRPLLIPVFDRSNKPSFAYAHLLTPEHLARMLATEWRVMPVPGAEGPATPVCFEIPNKRQRR